MPTEPWPSGIGKYHHILTFLKKWKFLRQQICSSSKYAPDVIFPNQMSPTHICPLNKHIILCKSIVFVCTYVLLNYWRRLVVIDVLRVLEGIQRISTLTKTIRKVVWYVMLKTLILNIPHIYTMTKTIRKVDDKLKTTILNWISTIFKFWNSRFDLILAFVYQQPMPV